MSFINSFLQGYSPKKVEDIYSYCAPHIFGHNPWRVRKEASSSASYSHSSYSYSYSASYSHSSYPYSFSSSSSASSLKFKESKITYFQTSDTSDKNKFFYGVSLFYCIFLKGN